MRVLTALLLACASSLGDIDEAPALVPLTPLPAEWKVLDVGPCMKAARVPCALAPFGQDERPVRIVFAGPEQGAARQECGPPFDEWRSVTFVEAPLRQVAMSEDFVFLVPEGEKYDPVWVTPGPRGWQWGWKDPRAPAMPEDVALAVVGRSGRQLVRVGDAARDAFAVHLDPTTRALEYYGWVGDCPPAVPLAKEERVLALTVDATGVIHALARGSEGILHISNRGGRVLREPVGNAGKSEAIRASIAACGRDAVDVVYRDDRTQGVQYWRRVAGTWRRVLLARGDGLGEYLGIAVDGASRPHVVYSTPKGLEYMTWGNGRWVRHAVTRDGPVAGCAVTIDASGHVHVCFADGARGKMKYATSLAANGTR
jgi:hypothetical protein